MSIIKEISESHDLLKSLAISLITAPLWYLSLYLFNFDCYNSADLIIKIILSCCLSVISTLLLLIFLNSIIDEKEYDIVDGTSMAVLILFVYKILYIFINYSVMFFWNEKLYFYWYIVIYFIPLIIVLLTLLGKKSKSK